MAAKPPTSAPSASPTGIPTSSPSTVPTGQKSTSDETSMDLSSMTIIVVIVVLSVTIMIMICIFAGIKKRKETVVTEQDLASVTSMQIAKTSKTPKMSTHQHGKIEMETHTNKSTNNCNDKRDGENHDEGNEGLDIKYQTHLVETLSSNANANATANDANLQMNDIISNTNNQENSEVEGLDFQKNTGAESVFQN